MKSCFCTLPHMEGPEKPGANWLHWNRNNSWKFQAVSCKHVPKLSFGAYGLGFAVELPLEAIVTIHTMNDMIYDIVRLNRISTLPA